jgi:hypothetical protein
MRTQANFIEFVAAVPILQRTMALACFEDAKETKRNWRDLKLLGEGIACIGCEGPAAATRCSRCKFAYYCSAECQKDHWPLHKLSCKKQVIPT